MHVIAYQSLDEMAIWAEQWHDLSRGVPFLDWEWCSNWWRVYGENNVQGATSRDLYVVGVHDDEGSLIAVAPWFVEQTATQGRVIRFLGSGEVCSDYLSILCEADREQEVARLLADFICHDRPSLNDWLEGEEAPQWDSLQLEGVDAKNSVVNQFATEMKQHGKTVEQSIEHNCWRLTLPDNWDAVVQQAPKSQRKHLRRANERLKNTELYRVCEVDSPQDFERGFEVLTSLHQARWQERGLSGCFASEDFASFHHNFAAELLERGKLRLFWIEYQGQPIASEYQLLGNDVVYLYQGGLDPQFLSLEPGRLAIVAGVRWALEHGFQAIDFLRGDEPYKARWGARPRAAIDVRIVNDHTTAQLRHHAWVTQNRIRGLVKSGLDYFRASR